MNIDSIISELTQEIAVRQDFLNAIHKFKGAGPQARPALLVTGGLVEKPKRAAKPDPVKVKRNYTKRATSPLVVQESNPVAAALDKPATVGGAMKSVIRHQTRFTGEALRNLLLADADYAKIIENASSSAFGFNLKYWTTAGHLTASPGTALEATYTVVNRAFFEP